MAKALKPGFQVSRGWRLFWLVMATLTCVALVPLGAVGAIFSWLVFDSPGNLLNPLAWLAFLLMVGFWIICILAPFGAWVFWSRKQEQWAWMAISTPLVWIVLTAAILQFVPA